MHAFLLALVPAAVLGHGSLVIPQTRNSIDRRLPQWKGGCVSPRGSRVRACAPLRAMRPCAVRCVASTVDSHVARGEPPTPVPVCRPCAPRLRRPGAQHSTFDRPHSPHRRYPHQPDFPGTGRWGLPNETCGSWPPSCQEACSCSNGTEACDVGPCCTSTPALGRPVPLPLAPRRSSGLAWLKPATDHACAAPCLRVPDALACRAPVHGAPFIYSEWCPMLPRRPSLLLVQLRVHHRVRRV